MGAKMIVQELIDELEKHDPQMKVFVNHQEINKVSHFTSKHFDDLQYVNIDADIPEGEKE